MRPRAVDGPRRLTVVVCALVAAILVVAYVNDAFADELVYDGDTVTAGTQTLYEFGNRAPGEIITHTIGVSLICDTKKHADRGSTVTVSKKDSASTIPGDGAMTMSSVVFTIPEYWPEDDTGGGTNCGSPAETLSSTSTVTITAPSTVGTYSYELAIERTVSSGTPGDVKDPNPAKLFFTLTVVQLGDTTPPTITCPANQTLEGNRTGGYTGTIVEATATDNTDPSPNISRVPSGSNFELGTTSVTWTATDESANSANCSANVIVVDTTKPVITCPANISGVVGESVTLGIASAVDVVDPAPVITNNAPASFGPGTTTVQWTATDASSNAATCNQTVTLVYNFIGFLAPVDNPPIVNVARAGSTIPLKWQLKDYNGDFVSDTATVGPIRSYQTNCAAGALNDEIETAATGGTLLRYDSTSDQFIYNWSTLKQWSGTCRTLVLALDDGTTHTALFKFR